MEWIDGAGLLLAVIGVIVFAFRRRLIPRKPVRFFDNRLAASNPLRGHPSTKHVVLKATGQRYLVTGGAGFLGSHVVEALLDRGETSVRILDVADNGRFAGDSRVEFLHGDLSKLEDCQRACEGVDVVFHTAAVIQYWASHDFQIPIHARVNVSGTANLLQACLAQGVRKLVQTSTSNVMMTHNGRGIDSVDGADERAPYTTERPCSPYGLTKGYAEKLVLEANGKDAGKGALLTCALRPPGIFGERDKLVEATVMDSLPLPLMGYMGRQDWVYVENLVHAHLLAEQKLALGSGVDGQAFFITNGPDGHINGGELYLKVAEAIYRDSFDRDQDTLKLPLWLLYSIAHPVDWFHRLTGGKFTSTQIAKLTPITIQYVIPDLRFNDNKARSLLGYSEIYSMSEAFIRMGIYNRGA
ncbi:MAG: NAD-dependent epimerase/dehydratase family protein [archaeon]|nr:NAD-dependent epimerase/dehydratase family protein [archaeon]